MDGIEVNGEFIDFDGSLAMVQNSSCFSDQISYSLQGTTPLTPKNCRIYGYLHKPEISDNKSREFPCKIHFCTMVIPGTWVVIYQSGSFSCYFKQVGDFWSSIKDKSLKDIDFNQTTFNNGTGYAEIIEFVSQHQENFDFDFTFPVIVNKTTAEKFPLKTECFDFINVPADQNSFVCPIIPFIYLRTVFEAIFKDLTINKNAFSNSFLRKLCIPNNFMINEFELDKTVIWSGDAFIIHITNEANPIVTTVVPHGINNYGFVKISNIPGMPIDDNIYQIEKVVDSVTNPDGSTSQVTSDVSFKLLNADFSAYPEFIRRSFRTSSQIKGSGDQGRNVDLTILGGPISLNGMEYVYIRSDDFNFKPGYFVASWDDHLYVYPENNQTRPVENNYDGHTYSNAIIYVMSKWESTIYFEGTLKILPSTLKNSFKSIDPANHVPNITIIDFLDQSKWLLGLVSFVRASGVDIKTFKEILVSSDFTDISNFSQLISDASNPGLDGYQLQMLADDSDTFYKSKVPFQTIDKKYTVKNSLDSCAFDINSKPLLADSDNSNDVVLIENKQICIDTPAAILTDKINSFYVFNKTILNDKTWKFLCYNMLDKLLGKGDLKISTKFSTLLHHPDIMYGYYVEPGISDKYAMNEVYLRHDVNCNCKNFNSDTASGLKLIIFYGRQTVTINPYPFHPPTTNFPVGYQIIYSSNDIYDFMGQPIDGAEFGLRWDGENGLYEKVWKEYIDWQLNVRKDCIAIIQWPVKMLADFDFSKKYRIRGIDYLVKSIKYNLNFKTRKIEFNETELAKV
jgi:hypothetical protein